MNRLHLLAMSIERTVLPLEVPRRTFLLALLVAFGLGITAAAFGCALLIR